MYDNECMFDRFDLHWSPSGSFVSSGGYNNAFNVLKLSAFRTPG